jgi:hypothetical protein
LKRSQLEEGKRGSGRRCFMYLPFIIEFWRILTVCCKYVILGVEG